MAELNQQPFKRTITMEQMPPLVGKELGLTAWLPITQDRISRFAACTNDDQWIHTDEARATVESPFGTTIAHGYLTLSLISYFVEQSVKLSDAAIAINYGLNKVRFPCPVKSNNQIRGRVTLQTCEKFDGGIQYTLDVLIEIQGNEKPACAAEVIFRALS